MLIRLDGSQEMQTSQSQFFAQETCPSTYPCDDDFQKYEENSPALGTRSLDRYIHALQGRSTLSISPIALSLAYIDWALHLMNSPGKRNELSEKAYRKYYRFLIYCLHSFSNKEAEPCIKPLPHDKRFQAESWKIWPFNWLHQGFLLSQQWMHNATNDVRGVTRHHEEVVSFVMRQIMDIFAPSNFPWTNPEVLHETISQNGINLATGFLNFLEDKERAISGKPPLEAENFKVGVNVAITPGKVIYRNNLIELIQYEPTTEKVKAEPILIVPAWIMKYYILDLSPENSLVKFLRDQGFTVFMISWKNPHHEDRDLGFEDYRKLGILESLKAIETIIPHHKVHGIGYCIGGTLLSIAASALERDNNHKFKTISLLASQVDFDEAAELKLFIDESQITYLEDIMWDQGYLNTKQMAGAFQLLRSNDLLWSRMIRQYLMGKREQGFDLMAWNADPTRMPFKMHSQYLRDIILHNAVASGNYLVDGRPITLSQITAPLFAVGAERDHVAPWPSVYKIHAYCYADITFLLTSGGHNAGIVSPPDPRTGHKQRTYRMSSRAKNNHAYIEPEAWKNLTPAHTGSWWIPFAEWLKNHSEDDHALPTMGASEKGYPALIDAPGIYVFQQ